MISIPFFMRETYFNDLTSWDAALDIMYKTYAGRITYT